MTNSLSEPIEFVRAWKPPKISPMLTRKQLEVIPGSYQGGFGGDGKGLVFARAGFNVTKAIPLVLEILSKIGNPLFQFLLNSIESEFTTTSTVSTESSFLLSSDGYPLQRKHGAFPYSQIFYQSNGRSLFERGNVQGFGQNYSRE